MVEIEREEAAFSSAAFACIWDTRKFPVGEDISDASLSIFLSFLKYDYRFASGLSAKTKQKKKKIHPPSFTNTFIIHINLNISCPERH